MTSTGSVESPCPRGNQEGRATSAPAFALSGRRVAVADITKAEIKRLDMTKSVLLGLAIVAGAAAAVVAAWAAVTRAPLQKDKDPVFRWILCSGQCD